MSDLAHVYAVDTESGGVHNCPLCHTLVVWGLTNKGSRARFDYPADIEGYLNHHVTCRGDPGKSRTRDVLDPRDLTFTCDDCTTSIFRGGILCVTHWRAYRRWLTAGGRDALTVWRMGEESDRRRMLLAWLADQRA